MMDVRRLDAYAQLADTAKSYLRIEGDYAEVALTARRYAAADSLFTAC